MVVVRQVSSSLSSWGTVRILWVVVVVAALAATRAIFISLNVALPPTLQANDKPPHKDPHTVARLSDHFLSLSSWRETTATATTRLSQHWTTRSFHFTTTNKNHPSESNKNVSSSRTATPVRKFEKYQEATSPGWAIFYNVFIHPNETVRAREIVRDQLGQIRRSYGARVNDLYNNKSTFTTVYFNTIGAKRIVEKKTFMKPLCDREKHGLQCIHLHHYKEASEDVTLQAVLDFCQAHPSQAVVYLHNKGSYHDALNRNSIWRRYLTSAVLSEACLTAIKGERTTTTTTNTTANHETPAPKKSPFCNSCSLQFYPQWGPFFAGNFWSASCDYVRLLLPPYAYKQAMDLHVASIQERFQTGTLQRDLIKTSVDGMDQRLCHGRFASECWIGSHPALQPCDLSKTNSLAAYKLGLQKTFDFELKPAPRFSFTQVDWFRMRTNVRDLLTQQHDNDATISSSRIRQYHLLAGHFLKWIQLYNQTPADDSWVWSWFPDGSKWKEGWKRHGTSVVDVLTTGFGQQPQKLQP